MITLKKRKGENKKMKREKKISGRLRHSLGWVQQLRGIIKGRKGEAPVGSIAENSISARLRDWILGFLIRARASIASGDRSDNPPLLARRSPLRRTLAAVLHVHFRPTPTA